MGGAIGPRSLALPSNAITARLGGGGKSYVTECLSLAHAPSINRELILDNMLNAGRPGATCTCTSTARASMPSNATVVTRWTICRPCLGGTVAEHQNVARTFREQNIQPAAVRFARGPRIGNQPPKVVKGFKINGLTNHLIQIAESFILPTIRLRSKGDRLRSPAPIG